MTRARSAAAIALCCAAALAPASARAANPFESLLASQRREPPAPVSREFASDDLLRAQRLAIAALQDLGFALESADAERGTLVASRLDAYALRVTVTLRAANETAVSASVATDLGGAPIADPRAAEAFFAAFAAQLDQPAPGQM